MRPFGNIFYVWYFVNNDILVYQYIDIAIIWRIGRSYYSHGIDCHGVQHKIFHNFSSESQAKFCQDRVAKVEKHYGNLCETLASITRKAARQRDKGTPYLLYHWWNHVYLVAED